MARWITGPGRVALQAEVDQLAGDLEAARAARQVGRTAGHLSENPQSLLYGNGPVAPGPGEPGFKAPAAIQ